MYVEAATSGLIADMGAERWQTLCVLASFMGEKGECYPTQDLIAKRLGVARETANRRVRNLYRYKWRGQRLIEMRKVRDANQRWANTVYTILPVSNLEIFGESR